MYRIVELRGLRGELTGLALAIPGLEAFSVKIVSFSRSGAEIVWENLPLAVGLDRDFMSPAETDIWLKRFKSRGELEALEKAPESFTELREVGFDIYSTRDRLDYAVGEGDVIALWYNSLTGRIDLAMEIQEKMGLHRWGEKLEAVKQWARKLELSR